MTRANPYQPAFNAGEISPRLWARTDFRKYPFAAEICENMIPLAEGALARRPGTRFVVETKNSASAARLKKFQFSDEQAYVIEIGDAYMRFCRYQAQITVATTDASIANGAFDSGISSWTDKSDIGASIAWDGSNHRMSLISNGSAVAHAEQSVTVADTYRSNEHVLKFRTYGVAGDIVKLRVGLTSGGAEIINDRQMSTGFHSVAFTPGSGGPLASQVSASTGTITTDFPTQAANIFDGITGQPRASCGSKQATAGTGYAGKDWGAGTTKKIVKYNVYSTSDDGFINAINPVVTINLRGSSSAPSSSSDGVLLDSQTFVDATGPLVISETATLDATTSYRYHWIEITTSPLIDQYSFYFAEIVFYESTTSAIFYVQFLSSMNKTLGVDNVSLISARPVEIGTAYAAADLSGLNGPQSADELYFFHVSYPTYRLDRRGHTTWSLVEVAWQDGPYLDENSTSTTLTPATTSGYGVSITASSTIGINDGDGFRSTDVGRLIRISNPASGTNWGWGIIVSYLSTTRVLVDVKRSFGSTNAATHWRLGAWSGTTGYPTVASFYEQRLCTAATTKQPQTIWMSQTADFENLAPDSENAGAWDGTVQDDDAIDWTISADEVNVVKWMVPAADTLVIGTTGGEWIPKSQGAVLTPSDISVRRQTNHACAAIGPIAVSNAVLFVQKAQRKIREFAYDFNSNGFLANDMTRLAAHISAGGVTEIDYAEEPDSIVYAVRSDGQMLAMTYRREEDVVGFSRWKLGGSYGTMAWAVAESIAVIPGANGSGQVQDSTNRDELWVLVKRTINGTTKRYIEVFERSFEHDVDDKTDAYYADSLITYDGSLANMIAGVGHLNNETVKMLADGAIVSGKTVSGGAVTLDVAASTVQIGLPYAHKFKGLKWEAGAVAGTAIGKVKRIVAMSFSLLDSALISYGPSETAVRKTKDYRKAIDAMDGVPDLFTGDDWVTWPDTWKRDARIYIEDDSPTPFTLLALAPELDTRDLK